MEDKEHFNPIVVTIEESKENNIPFSMNEKLTIMRASEDKRMKIIALYWSYKGWKFQNELQYKKAIQRELRISKELLGYDSKQITETMDFCDKEFEMWGLETIAKRIEDIALGGL